MACNQSPCSDGIVGLFFLLRWRGGINPLVMPPATWGRSFYSSGGAGLFILLCFWQIGVVTFVMTPAAWVCSFCYASSGSGPFLLFLWWVRVVPFVMPPGNQCWIFTVSVVLVQSTLTHRGQRGFFLIGTGCCSQRSFLPVVAGLSQSVWFSSCR